MRNPRVVALAYDGQCAFELGVVVEVFGLPRPEFAHWYDFRLCSADRGLLRATGGLQLRVPHGLKSIDSADTVVIPGWRDPDEIPPQALLKKLQRARARGARIISVCSGVFVLAAAGLLDGRRATTHWRYTERLAQRYPNILVDANVLYVDEGSVMTSAGSAAGIDLCLHVVCQDFGAEIANAVARRLVVPPHREGGQAQFIEQPLRSSSGGGFSEWLDGLRHSLDQPHTIATMAQQFRVSPRTLARRFRETAGETPLRWLTRERVRLAQRLLETTREDVERIAEHCGFGGAQMLRLYFRRLTGTSPSQYRKSFQHDVHAG
jgi:AraC family transcriptional activator FtrA